MLAPCGMDCSHCSGYLNEHYGPAGKKVVLCSGCRARDKNCAFLKQHCDLLRRHEIDFCYECDTFPCDRLRRLEERYEKRGWANSFLDNNRRIKEIGPEAFLKEQEARFACPNCGTPTSVHDGLCHKCGRTKPLPPR